MNNSEREFDVLCSQTLSKTSSVTTDKYRIDKDEESNAYYDTSDIIWEEEYYNAPHYTPLQLIGILKKVLKTNLAQGIVYETPSITRRLIKECSDWEEDNTLFIEE